MGIVKRLEQFSRPDEVLEGPKLNNRGFIPFQFSSRRIQMNTTQLGGLIPNNPISELATETRSWYEMWINPTKVSINRSYLQQRKHTAGAVVTFHYRPEVYTMDVSGVCGWIGIGPGVEGDKSFKDQFRSLAKTQNSPRIFLKRLRDIANEPMYFVDWGGVEHYNAKYIKIFTKQYPDGVICEGYFTNFNIPETGEDAQTIEYSFQFIIESMKSVKALQNMAGMFKSTVKAGSKLKSMWSTSGTQSNSYGGGL